MDYNSNNYGFKIKKNHELSNFRKRNFMYWY